MKIDLHSAVFYSRNIPAIIEFYQNKLGLELDYNEDNYFVSFIFPSGKKLGIRQEKGEREKAGHQTVFFAVDNIDEYYKKIQGGDFKIYRGLETHSWGRAFAIMDPDNNKIEFIES